MRVLEVATYRGPHYYSSRPMIRIRLDLGALEDWPTHRLPAHFVDRLLVALPGLDGWEEAVSGPDAWHVGFLQTPGLPETLVAGRHAAFLGHFLAMGKHSAKAAEESLKAYASPAQFHAACEMYRAFPANAAFGRDKRGPSQVPIVYATGEHSPLAALRGRIVAALRDSGFAHVTQASVPDAGHYIVADNPEGVAGLIENVHAKPRRREEQAPREV